MATEWVKTLGDGKLDLSLPVMSLVRGDGVRFDGSGRLQWRADSRVRIWAETGNADALQGELAEFLGHGVGKIIPRDRYFSLEAATQDGWAVFSESVPFDGYTVHFASPWVVWDFEVPGLTMVRSVAAREHPRAINALLGASPTEWTRMTATQVENPVFGSESNTRDWMLSDSAFGRVAAREYGGGWFEVWIEVHRDDYVASPASDIVAAVQQAFAFVLGHEVPCRGWHDMRRDSESRHLEPILQGFLTLDL